MAQPGAPRSKGIAIIPIVQALRASGDWALRELPRSLQHYLTDQVLPSSWYPDEDWLALLDVLARRITREQAPEGAYVLFGRLAALRDLGDDQQQVPPAARTDTGGIYRQLAAGKLDPVGLIRRLAKIWSLYHDTGTIVIERDARRPNVVVYRLEDYPLGRRCIFEMNRGYAEEYGKLTGVPCKVLSMSATPARGDAWVMELQFPQTPANVQAIATL